MEDVARIALALPDVTEGQRFRHRTWFVNKKAFLWERPFSKADIKRFGEAPVPDGDIVAITTADLGEKEAILGAGDAAFFTIEHLDNYPAVLVQLKKIKIKALREAILDGWLACAPAQLAEPYLASRRP